MYNDCASLGLLCQGKKGAKSVYISLVFIKYSKLKQNVTDDFWGLITKLVLV